MGEKGKRRKRRDLFKRAWGGVDNKFNTVHSTIPLPFSANFQKTRQ
jgi:hypothetical protein